MKDIHRKLVYYLKREKINKKQFRNLKCKKKSKRLLFYYILTGVISSKA